MPSPLDILRAAYADPYAAAREHRAAGGKVVGYFLNAVPEELIDAAGCFPVRLRGEPQWRSPLAEKYMEEYMDGEVRAIFGALLEGRFDFADLIVIPRNSEVYLQLYYFLLELPKWEPQVRIPPVYLFDLLQTPNSTTLRYVLGRMQAFSRELERLTRRVVEAEHLSISIARTNDKRAAQRAASKLWHAPDSALSGVDALQAISCASFMQREHYIDTLNALVEQPPVATSSGPRILLKGSPQSDTRVTSLIERLGARVVAHDHLWGDRTYEAIVPERSEPWTTLARHYCLDIPSPREYPQSKADERFMTLVAAAHVDGVIFYHDEWDDTLGWEYPDQKRLLDARGIGSLFLKRQPYFDPNEDAQTHTVQAFIDQLRQRR